MKPAVPGYTLQFGSTPPASRPRILTLKLSALMFAVLFLAPAAPVTASPSSPYAGEEVREIKALTSGEVEGLLAGKGMGYGKSAELNGYPGPAHVLELASELQLTDDQLQTTRDIHARMEAAAKAGGAQLVAAEAQLERLFRSGAVDESGMASALGLIGRLQAELRGAHLSAHVEQRRVLTAEQIERYVHLRGYRDGRGSDHGH